MTRKILIGSLVLTPIALIAHYVFHVSDTATFVLAALALMPLAWLIGEATEHAAEHTGPGIGGFLNASFGNAPELIIALLAVYNGLPDVVRGSIIGSVVSNLLLVLGLTMFVGAPGDGRPALAASCSSAIVGVGDASSFFIPSIPGWHGDPERHTLYLVTLPDRGRAARALRRGHDLQPAPPPRRARHVRVRRAAALEHAHGARRARRSRPSRPRSSAEMLVGSLEAFGEAVGLSDFFVAIVIVAIVGNAAEHGGAIVVARRGKIKLATEIAVSSAAQVAVFVAPAAALLSALVGTGLPLAFRPVELATMAVATLVVSLLVLDARSKRWEGRRARRRLRRRVVAAYWIAGDR